MLFKSGVMMFWFFELVRHLRGGFPTLAHYGLAMWSVGLKPLYFQTALSHVGYSYCQGRIGGVCNEELQFNSLF